LTFRAKSQILAVEETEVFMPDFAAALGANKAASTLLVLFILSKDRRNKPINQRYWVNLHRMGREARQGAIGLVIDDDYLEIGFPLDDASTARQPKAKKRT
jgi:hypothetical protein